MKIMTFDNLVAPRTGAWIETGSLIVIDEIHRSPLAQGRGLKLLDLKAL